MAKARPLARKAMELGPDLAEPHATVGLIRAYADWDWDGAEAAFLRAIELNPAFAWAHNQYAHLLAEAGRFEEALAHYETASELDPVIFDSGGTDQGRVLEWLGRIDDAVSFWDDQIELSPGHYAPYLRKGDHYCRNGSYEQAIPLLERAAELNRLDPWVVGVRAYCHAISGNREAALELRGQLEQVDAAGYVTPMAFALIEVGLGDLDRAFHFLERAYALRAMRLLVIEFDPRFDPIRGDPRYERLMRRLGPGLPAGRRAIARLEAAGV
jgi:tetratricopeptide (TPR) repeat protein